MKALESKCVIQVFVVMVGYYQRFIINFSNIAEPLFFLLQGSNLFLWTVDCEQVFLELKKALMSASVLNYLGFDKPFTVHTDTSLFAIGSVLLLIG